MAFDPVFGNMAHEAEMRGNGVKGNLMAKRAWYVRRFYGDEVFDELVGKLTGEAREFMVNPPLTMSWCSFGAMMDIDRAILEGPMHGDNAKMKHFGGEIAKHDLPTLYKVLFKVGSPAFVMQDEHRGDSVHQGYVDHRGDADGQARDPHARQAAVAALLLHVRRAGLVRGCRRALRRQAGDGDARRVPSPRRRAVWMGGDVALIPSLRTDGVALLIRCARQCAHLSVTAFTSPDSSTLHSSPVVSGLSPFAIAL